MENNNSSRYIPQQPEGIDLKQLGAMFIRNWYWFAILAVVGLGLGLVTASYSKQEFKISSTILIKSDGTENTLATLFQDLGLKNKKANVQNQIGILKSYSLNLKTLENLNWSQSWYEQSLFKKTDLYQREPFALNIPETAFQTKNIPVYVTPISASAYEIEVDKQIEENGVKKSLKFNAEGKFGVPFKNDYFEFTLQPVKEFPFQIGQQYILEFNDLSKLALQYQELLEVTMSNEESDIIYVSLESTEPARAVNYLNELGDVFIEFGLSGKNRIANNTVNFIENQIAGVTESLQSAGQNFTDYRSKNRIVDLGQEGGIVIEKLEEIEQQEALSKMKLEYYQNLKRYLNEGNQMQDLIAPSVVGVTDPALNSLVLNLSDLYSQREVLSYTVQDKNPNLLALDKEINYTKKVLEENMSNLLNNSKIELKNLQQQKQRINYQLSALPKTEQNLINMKRSFDLNNDLYTFLLQRRAEAGIAKAANDPDAQILDPARIDTALEIGPEKAQITLIGLALGLGFPLIFFTAFSYFDTRLNTIKDVESQLGLPVAGMIQSNKFKSELPAIEFPHSGIAESFRGLKLNLQYLLKDRQSKVIAVHSSIAGEGKSFITANLAASIAVNKKVLLVEADMRKPRIHYVLECNNEKGLSNYLNGKFSLMDIVQPTSIKGLNFVAAGPVPFYPSELLNNGLLEKFIDDAQKSYDYIIFDNAPASIVNDAMMIAPFADINVFVLKLKSSTKNQLEYVNRVANEGIVKNIVVALNSVTTESRGFKNKSYGYYNEDSVAKMNQKASV